MRRGGRGETRAGVLVTRVSGFECRSVGESNIIILYMINERSEDDDDDDDESRG